jgi:hypothetical protein
MTEDRILAAALAIDDPEARSAFLDGACAEGWVVTPQETASEEDATWEIEGK